MRARPTPTARHKPEDNTEGEAAKAECGAVVAAPKPQVPTAAGLVPGGSSSRIVPPGGRGPGWLTMRSSGGGAARPSPRPPGMTAGGPLQIRYRLKAASSLRGGHQCLCQCRHSSSSGSP